MNGKLHDRVMKLVRRFMLEQSRIERKAEHIEDLGIFSEKFYYDGIIELCIIKSLPEVERLSLSEFLSKLRKLRFLVELSGMLKK